MKVKARTLSAGLIAALMVASINCYAMHGAPGQPQFGFTGQPPQGFQQQFVPVQPVPMSSGQPQPASGCPVPYWYSQSPYGFAPPGQQFVPVQQPFAVPVQPVPMSPGQPFPGYGQPPQGFPQQFVPQLGFTGQPVPMYPVPQFGFPGQQPVAVQGQGFPQQFAAQGQPIGDASLSATPAPRLTGEQGSSLLAIARAIDPSGDNEGLIMGISSGTPEAAKQNAVYLVSRLQAHNLQIPNYLLPIAGDMSSTAATPALPQAVPAPIPQPMPDRPQPQPSSPQTGTGGTYSEALGRPVGWQELGQLAGWLRDIGVDNPDNEAETIIHLRLSEASGRIRGYESRAPLRASAPPIIVGHLAARANVASSSRPAQTPRDFTTYDGASTEFRENASTRRAAAQPQDRPEPPPRPANPNPPVPSAGQNDYPGLPSGFHWLARQNGYDSTVHWEQTGETEWSAQRGNTTWTLRAEAGGGSQNEGAAPPPQPATANPPAPRTPPPPAQRTPPPHTATVAAAPRHAQPTQPATMNHATTAVNSPALGRRIGGERVTELVQALGNLGVDEPEQAVLGMLRSTNVQARQQIDQYLQLPLPHGLNQHPEPLMRLADDLRNATPPAPPPPPPRPAPALQLPATNPTAAATHSTTLGRPIEGAEAAQLVQYLRDIQNGDPEHTAAHLLNNDRDIAETEMNDIISLALAQVPGVIAPDIVREIAGLNPDPTDVVD
ncbi:MAG: hypothetical protein LBJ69_02410 [Holosporales bacterium]|nr:hypothetical protein [Holosporales bacterium]